MADFISAGPYAYTGETIHFKNTSIDAHHYQWTGPDGKTYQTTDLDYPTNIDDTTSILKFTLEAFSKNGRAKNTVTKQISMKQGILSTDYFSVSSMYYRPIEKSAGVANGNLWRIFVKQGSTNNAPNMSIYFAGFLAPVAGTYTLVPNSYAIGPGQASVYIWDGNISHNSNSGTLTVTGAGIGRVRAEFLYADDGYSRLLSGDITVY